MNPFAFELWGFAALPKITQRRRRVRSIRAINGSDTCGRVPTSPAGLSAHPADEHHEGDWVTQSLIWASRRDWAGCTLYCDRLFADTLQHGGPTLGCNPDTRSGDRGRTDPYGLRSTITYRAHPDASTLPPHASVPRWPARQLRSSKISSKNSRIAMNKVNA